MPISQTLHVHRRDTEDRALVTLSGEIDLHTAPVLSEALEGCLRDGIRVIDIDLTAVPFCDCSGLNALLIAAESGASAGRVLRLHHPCPTLVRILTITGSGSLLPTRPPLSLPSGPVGERPVSAYEAAAVPAGLAVAAMAAEGVT